MAGRVLRLRVRLEDVLMKSYRRRLLQDALLVRIRQHFARPSAQNSGRFAERRYADEPSRHPVSLGLDHIAFREHDPSVGSRVRNALICTMVTVVICTLAIPAGSAPAAGRIHVVVRTVLASQGQAFMDPELSDLVHELQSLFRYSSYRLLGKDRLALNLKEQGTVALPGKRVLKITPTRIHDKRVELELVIFKKKRRIFETVIQLLNHGRLVVGGPQYKKGALLFDISSSF